MKSLEEEISSNCLFHYSPKEKLIKILQTKRLIPKYSIEDLLFVINEDNAVNKIAVPMICFCDLPLRLANSHTKIYGKYAIGIEKKWAIKELHVNPIMYIQENSSVDMAYKVLRKMIWYGLESIQEKEAKGPTNIERWDLKNGFESLLIHSKIIMGDYNYKGKPYPNYNYYNEREWRYIPNITGTGLSYRVPFNEEVNETIIEKQNEELKKYYIEIPEKEITHIIINKENEKNEFKELLYQIYDNTNAEILCNRIISFEELEK